MYRERERERERKREREEKETERWKEGRKAKICFSNIAHKTKAVYKYNFTQNTIKH